MHSPLRAPTCPARDLFTKSCNWEHPQTHSAATIEKSLPHSHYGLDYRAIIPPSSCVIHRSHPFTLLMALGRPTPARAQKARNRPRPQHWAPPWCCGEVMGELLILTLGSMEGRWHWGTQEISSHPALTDSRLCSGCEHSPS